MKFSEEMIERQLLTKEELQQKVCELGKIISEDYAGEEIVLVTLLRGGAVFSVDLMREISVPVEFDCMCVSSYGNGAESSGVVKIVKDLETDIEGRHVLLVEDIIDSGVTLSNVKDMLLQRKPKSIKICTILNKPSRRRVDVDVEYIGFDIPDEFVIGYGLDYAQKFRNLPYVGILKREVYEK